MPWRIQATRHVLRITKCLRSGPQARCMCVRKERVFPACK